MTGRPAIHEPISKTKWGIHIHPSLLEMAEVVKQERNFRPGTAVTRVVLTLTIQFPTLEQVHQRYDPYFAELRQRADHWVDKKERSFYSAIERDLAALSPERTVVVDQPFIAT